MSAEAALEAAGVVKRYGHVVALGGVDLTIEPGEILGLVGPNGAGKTTLISILACLLQPDAGTVCVAGVDVVADPGAARSCVGLAPQTLGVYPALTAEENLVFFARLAGVAARAARARAADLAESLGLSAARHRRVGTLSAGERRRVHLACSLVGTPRLLLLDEPTAGADPDARGALLNLVRDLAAAGTAVCYSTHQLGEVEMLGASVAVLHRGRMVARGSVASLIAAHGSPTVELSFFGPAPAPPPDIGGSVQGDTIRIQADDPGELLARWLRAAGGEASRLRSVDVVRPGLEAVFAAVTGEAYPAEPPTGPPVEPPGRVLAGP